MIISHRNRFIFVKTGKTAGTSLKVALAASCGEEDVVTPTMDPRHDLRPRNYRGLVNPLPELRTAARAGITVRALGLKEVVRERRRFGGHTPAWLIRHRAPREWAGYLTFCVERNPWEKVVSGWSWVRTAHGQDLELDAYLDFIEAQAASGHHGTGACPYNYPNYTDPLTGEVIVDRILRYERLGQDLADLMEELSLPVPDLPMIYGDRRRSGSAAETLTRSQIDRVSELFAAEIELHGYTPPV